MRTLALLLAAGAVSVIGVAASDPNSLFSLEKTSSAAVAQNSSNGSIEYIASANLSAEKMLTVATDINAFQLAHLGDFSIDSKNETIKDHDNKNIKFDYSVTFEIKHVIEKINNKDINIARLIITFGNYYSYARFNDIALAPPVKSTSSLFFIERTNKFNAYTRYFDTEGQSKKTALVVSKFIETFDKNPTTKTEYMYALLASSRRSKTNANLAENEFGTYSYYFKISADLQNEVVIFDRRANTPIWYGIAVGVTAVAMVGFYFIAKQLRKPRGSADESGQDQYPYHDNLH